VGGFRTQFAQLSLEHLVVTQLDDSQRLQLLLLQPCQHGPIYFVLLEFCCCCLIQSYRKDPCTHILIAPTVVSCSGVSVLCCVVMCGSVRFSFQERLLCLTLVTLRNMRVLSYSLATPIPLRWVSDIRIRSFPSTPCSSKCDATPPKSYAFKNHCASLTDQLAIS